MATCRICDNRSVRAPGEVCDVCSGNIVARAAGRDVDENDPAVREFDAEMAKFGLPPSPSQRTQPNAGCVILLVGVAAIPVIMAALGVLALVA
ncbi:hypothetical protein GCM10010403_39950 [Glycomyces rutgersensis]|uniref:Uncharacterized protein n=1 Tax=Glycomyces rutgersensis TaxID=58115 RepID=A0ABN3G2J5_9ACTN